MCAAEFLGDPTILDVNGVAMSTAVQTPTLSVPPGVSVTRSFKPRSIPMPWVNCCCFIRPAQSTSTANWQVVATTSATGAGSPVRVRTNLSAQINVIGSAFGSLYFVNTLGWRYARERRLTDSVIAFGKVRKPEFD
jgi:hypothetical protein